MGKTEVIDINVYSGRMIKLLIAEKLSIDPKFIKNLGLGIKLLLFNTISSTYQEMDDDVNVELLPSTAKLKVLMTDLD